MIHLLVDLDGEKFNADALAAALSNIEKAGFSVERVTHEQSVVTPYFDRFLAWLDDEFGGCWSSEAFVGSNIIARKGERIAGFATYDPKGLRFRWLRGIARHPKVGIFGPFGVAADFRGSSLGKNLLIAALASLRESKYINAVIPAVGDAKLAEYYSKNADAIAAENFPIETPLLKPVRTVVLASGNGSNFQSVLDRTRDKELPLKIDALVCNNAKAYAIERARDAGSPTHVVSWNRLSETRSAYDERLLSVVEEEKPELVLLLGWMHLLPATFIEAFPNTINIHPAFLPLDQSKDTVTLPDGSVQRAFRGPHAVQDALAADANWIGATAHRLSLGTDSGPILVRKPIPIAGLSGDESAVLQKLRPVEHDVLAAAIRRVIYEW